MKSSVVKLLRKPPQWRMMFGSFLQMPLRPALLSLDFKCHQCLALPIIRFTNAYICLLKEKSIEDKY